MAKPRSMHQHKGPSLGDERWKAENISYKAWCAVARKRGWDGDEDQDSLREYCEPEEAATVTIHASLDAAILWAKETFKADPDDSAFGAIIIDHQVLEAAHDDSGNLVSGCRPEWETVRVYEVTHDGDVTESSP